MWAKLVSLRVLSPDWVCSVCTLTSLVAFFPDAQHACQLPSCRDAVPALKDLGSYIGWGKGLLVS